MARTRIYVPRETAAVSVGADDVAIAIARHAKESGDNIELIRNGSWGAAWLEPLVEVAVDDKRIAYGNVEAVDIPELFASGFLSGDEHAKRIGPTLEIPYLINQDRWTFWRCGLIDPLSIDDFRAHHGFKALEMALDIGAQAVIDAVRDSGLRGRGGAGFPTGIKWQTVADVQSDQKYIACNADEGDGGTFSDRILMEGDPLGLIESMAIAGFAVGADRGYIYLRSEYPLTHRILSRAIEVARDNGWLGDDIQGSGFNFDIELHLGAGSYVCGEETAMLESLEGKPGIVRFKPPLPAFEGLFGQPTVVNNVVTLASVANIVNIGSEKYASYGIDRSKGTLAFQLAGNIKRGGLVEKGFGITLREIIEDWGGGTASGRPVKAVQVGGPLGAYLPVEQLDTPLTYEAFIEIGAMVGHGGIVVFDDTADMAQQARFAMEFCAIESCGKCTPCRIGSTRGVEVIDKIVAGENRDDNFELLVELCDTMEDASLCAMGGMTPYPVRSVLKHFAGDFSSAGSADA
ncbi:MAG: NADH-ubiquinone oxidoreductase-F iron-sulfur binding region domain-containing protein [Woeseiaceae bacterium]|nr:NADH-ubiquinone oxidoreductase-F iron-sulfur binding region domain-containing protein [Woeseiaceae bacterium]MDX2607880.1 NADH-ubiquinone oxidoreductase-F iron-sulfur binding region domain-containing protein [Woeseiaceae bacterium]